MRRTIIGIAIVILGLAPALPGQAIDYSKRALQSQP